jgi:hypothetical protein
MVLLPIFHHTSNVYTDKLKLLWAWVALTIKGELLLSTIKRSWNGPQSRTFRTVVLRIHQLQNAHYRLMCILQSKLVQPTVHFAANEGPQSKTFCCCACGRNSYYYTIMTHEGYTLIYLAFSSVTPLALSK